MGTEFLALGLYAAKDEEVLGRYLRAVENGETEVIPFCEAELIERRLGARSLIGGFQLEEDAAKQLDEMREATRAKTKIRTCRIKKAFPNREAATDYSIQRHLYHSPYKCNVCSEWHLTSNKRR